MEPQQTIGLAHFLGQADVVGKSLLAILLLMSVITWYLIITKTITAFTLRQRTRRFLDTFWNAPSLQAVATRLEDQHPDEPFSHLTWHAIVAARHHQRHGGGKLDEAGSGADFITRSMRRVIDEETARFESGLTVLASVGSTAPFIGLFGTVWGVYHALVAIGMTGSRMLDKVAGPVGEALIMTGIGLAVALPAVMGYNWLTRSNRVLTARLDAFAFELLTFLSMGRSLQASQRRQSPPPGVLNAAE